MQSFGKRLTSLDQFGQSFSIRFEEGRDVLPSKMGAACTILLAVILITYGGYKASILEGRKSVDILSAVQEDHYDEEFVFSGEQGFNVAVAVVDPFASPDQLEQVDPSYGRIVFSTLEWGKDDGD